jgi:predicted metal-dependent hydrolase
MSETLQIGELNFEVRRSARRRTIGLTVDRNSELVIHAPEVTPTSELQQWTQRKMLWVHQKLALKQKVGPLREPEFVSGETLSYLGRSYPLKVVNKMDEALRFDGGRFWLRVDARSVAPKHFRTWYTRAGREWLTHRVSRVAQKTGTKPTLVEIRELGFRCSLLRLENDAAPCPANRLRDRA